ncbi:VOC family protein [Domibacillus enclensis]|uniref:PhnB protein n=1 Tax=Domibacillus enclensis TaxID=1017273 RepID=A0A1N6ZLN2_9BACI|nr:VOC family protein [Domibacillus enclensis]OXS76736.1 VOC family protein [Domibacillus enclensis]SIR27684.1 PhnB protein [Domibacillus enclensis]
MAIQPYFVFDGNCGDVLDFYERVFQAEPAKRQTFGEMPPHPDHPVPEEVKNRIMHANMEVEGTTLMFSDTFPGMPFQQGSTITLTIVSADEQKLTSYFEGLSEGGEVAMPLQETFWSKLYGQVRDKYGIEWQVNYQS